MIVASGGPFDPYTTTWGTTGWAPFFTELESCSSDLRTDLQRLGLASEEHVEREGRLRRSADQRAVQLPGEFSGSEDDLTMLAVAFARGEPGSLAVPYQALGDT